MAGTFDRDTIVRRLRADRDAGRAIYDALCGSGITAKMAARGGASMVTTHALVCPDAPGVEQLLRYHRIPFTRAVLPFTPAAAAPHPH